MAGSESSGGGRSSPRYIHNLKHLYIAAQVRGATRDFQALRVDDEPQGSGHRGLPFGTHLNGEANTYSLVYVLVLGAGSHPCGAVRVVPPLVVTVAGRWLVRMLRLKILNVTSATRLSSWE